MQKLQQWILRLVTLVMTAAAALPRLIKSGAASLILLYLSWPVTIFHRFWNNSKPHKVSLFLLEVKKNGKPFIQDVQWYIYDTGNILSNILIVLSFILLKTKSRSYSLSLKVILTINFIDLIHYWLCFKQNEAVIWLESMLMVLLSLYLITQRKWKKVLKSGKP